MIAIKDFALDQKGDLIIENSDIQIVEGEELLKQTIKNILSTNKGEWFLDWEQGIEFSNILGKGVTEEIVQAEIEEGLQQVDETLHISEFKMNVNGRSLTVSFKATNEEKDTEIEVTETWD